MAGTKGNNLKDKAARGEYSLMEPFDYMVLEKLPEVGTLFAGLYPLGETAKSLISKFPKIEGKPIPSTTMSSRLLVLHKQGLVSKIDTTVPGTGTRGSWQRTRAGTKLYKEWKEKTGGTGSK